MEKYTHLLFDADNTLFDFDGSAKLAFVATLNHYQVPITTDSYDEYQKINTSVWKELEQGIIDQEELKRKRWKLFWKANNRLHDSYETEMYYLDQLIEHVLLLDGARELVESLHGKKSLSIITNGLKEVQRPRISKVGLTSYFDTIVVSDEIGVAKPHAAFFDHTMQNLNFPEKGKCLVIGDSLSSDILGGVNYGLDTCWFNLYKKPNNTLLNPTYEVSNMNELTTLLLR